MLLAIALPSSNKQVKVSGKLFPALCSPPFVAYTYIMKSFTTLLALVCLFASCAAGQKGTLPEDVPGMGKTSGLAAQLPSGDGLKTPRFRALPPEAWDYLETLAKAFREKDKAFLISQGEAQYEKELRFTLDEEIYLALLYR